MRLRDIVEINQSGLVADAVNLKMMADDSKNLPLCQGFVFNYDAEKQKRSTLGVLDALRESFHSTSSLNVHLMVQDFGKGKSHFALTLANFFKKPFDSPEIEGILHQVNFATSGKTNALHEKLKAYKKRSKTHLVICISGEVATDLNKMVLRGLRQALEDHGIGDAIAQHIIQKPLAYLKGLSREKRKQAEQYLEEIDQPYGDLDTTIELLGEDNYDIIPTVVDLSERLEEFPYNFEYNLDIEKIIEDVIQSLCTGENRRFEGVLILLDEINAYLRAWLKNSKAAGNAALQNITNVCERNRGKIALLCLAQIKPSLDTQIPYLERKNYERFTTRIELAPSTYEPRASLELVIDNLLKQSDSSNWHNFRSEWGDTIWRESCRSYEQYITTYSNRNWPIEDFHKHLGLGCYPLHPLTGYLLCNLEFTQGRTAIQFIKEDVAQFIESSKIEANGELQFVRPVQLMDAFASNFSLQSKYAEYEKAYDSIAASASADELIALKAIALYYLCGEKISKPDRERHDAILSVMTGFSPSKTKQLLRKLSDDYQVVYYNAGSNTYRFFTGFSIADLKRKIEEDTEDKTPNFNDLLKYCRRNLTVYLGSDTIRADHFASKHRLNAADWEFEKEIFSIDQFERVLLSERSVKKGAVRGVVAYFVGEYDQDLDVLEKEAELILSKAPKAVQERIILALPKRGTRDLAKVLAMKQALSSTSSREKQEFGAALTELNKQFDEQLDSELNEIFESCVYTCRVIDKVPRADLKKLGIVVSKMLDELYTYVPPVENIDKLRTRSTAGSQVVSYTSVQLLANDLKEPFPNKSFKSVIDPVFIRKWKMLKAGTPYTVTVPQDPNIQQAWDVISEMTDIGEKDQKSVEVSEIWKVLSEAPYGHNELTFTILFAAWLAFHRAEVELSGAFGIPSKKNTVTVKTAPLYDWARQTNILEKAKDFVGIWVLRGKNQVVRRKALDVSVPNSVSYVDAANWIKKISGHAESGTLEPSKVAFLREKQQQIQQGIDTIDVWNQPSIEAQQKLDQLAPLEVLATYYAPLENKPPAITIREGVTTVRVTQEQANNWRQTKKALKEKIEELVEDISKQAQNFENPEKGQSITKDIEYKLERLANVPELPIRFSESLRSALESAEQRSTEIRQLAKRRALMEKIQRLHRSLNTNSTQNQYSNTLERISSFSATIPEVQQETEYLSIIADIEGKQDTLIRKIDAWESQFSSISSLNEAVQLSEEVNRERNRFDSEANQPQVESLVNRIQDRILRKGDEDNLEKELTAIVQKSRQKLESVSSFNNFSDVVQAYTELSQLSLPIKAAQAENTENCQLQLQDSQAEGEKAIRQRLKQLCQYCDQEIKRADEYEQLKISLSKAQRLVTEQPELASEQEKLQQAQKSLEDRYSDLQKSDEDRIIIREIQKIRPGIGNTILRCEDVVELINELRSQLNFPEQHTDITERLINAFQGKRAEYTFSLDDLAVQLQSVETASKLQQLRNELSKLEFVFKDSSEYPRYQALEDALNSLGEDLDKVSALEVNVLSTQSIAEIEQALIEIAESKLQLYDADRFNTKLASIEATLTQRQKQFIDELSQWEQDLCYLTESSAARKVQSKVSGGESRYKDSEYAETYDSVRIDVNQLTQLLALADTQKVDSIEACQSEIDRLQNWKEDQELVSETIEKRIQSIEQSLWKIQQTIKTRKQNAAKKWLFGLQDEVAQINLSTEAFEKLETANAILKKISLTRSKHEAFLEDSHKDLLIKTIEACKLIQNHNRASKIETLFKELPKEERIELYQRLSAYLDNTTEVF